MSNSVVLIAYEINAQTAKTVLQKRAGFSAKFKKFKVSNIVDHVATCWEQLEQLFVQEDARIEDRVLYTAKLRDPLRIGKVRNDILNNSFLMSVLVDDTQFGRQARAGARYYQFKTNSDFEKKQFSLMLEEAKGRFEHQEVGIFGWVSISDERVDGALKTVASKFSNLNDGELHFIELTQAGDIFPNFSNVSSQKFEGKLAGNYSLTLKRDEYESGIQRINEITSTVTRKSAIPVVSTTSENSQVQAPQEATETMSENTSNKKNTYSDDFKKEVAEAAQSPGATLASVGEQFGVSPTLVRNWKIKFSEEVETPTQSEEKQPKIESKSIQSWLQKSVVEGTIDSDGDLYVSLETSSEETTQEPTKLFITGTQKLASGSKNETSGMSDQITTNETNWLRSDFLKGVGRENAQFSYNLNCDVYGCAERVVVPTKLKKGKVSECPITAGQIGISELNFVFEDGDFRAEGTITGPNGFIYAAEVLTEEPEEGHVPAVNKTADDENSAEMYEFLWDVKKGDTVFVVLCAFERLDGKLSCGFTGEAKVEEPISYDDGDDTNDFDEDKYSDYTEVVIDDEENEQYYYWVLTDDEDEAVEAALKKHDEMGRPNAVNDEDAGVFPMAYQPVTEFGSESSVRILVDATDVAGIEDIETQEGDIGLFEFQIKRGLVDEENLDDEEIADLVNELKELCENEEFEMAATLLLPKLSFEFGTDQLDDDPGEFFADLDYIEIECTEDNTSVKVGSDGDLVVTISVQFEIPLQAGISTQNLADYLPDSGAWAAASVSPGWGYSGSDGDNVWFVGIKGNDEAPQNQLESKNGKLKINAGWERRDANYICRWIIVWQEMKNGCLAGAIGGYSGGGVFQMEQFYAEYSDDRLTSLMIDIEDKVTQDEIDFWNDRPVEAAPFCDEAQDEIMAWHDENKWEDWEQLMLLETKRTNLVEDGDLLLLSTDKSPFVRDILELAGITAAPK